jgi:plastocyanin
MNTKIAVAVGLAAILASVFALPQAAFAAEVNVSITVGASSKTTDAYSPNPIEVSEGDTVIWTNDDTTPHTATSGTVPTPDGIFGGNAETGGVILVKGKTQSFTFAEEGTYPYFCTLHPNMVGTVTVGGGGGNGNGGGEPTESTATATLDGSSYPVTAMSTAKATAATIQASESVMVTFDKAGEVQLTLPKDMISNITSVMAGDAEVEFEQEDAADSTTLSFTIPEGETEVTVMGSFVVPEFPVIAALILGITIAGIVGYTRFAKGSTTSLFGRV